MRNRGHEEGAAPVLRVCKHGEDAAWTGNWLAQVGRDQNADQKVRLHASPVHPFLWGRSQIPRIKNFFNTQHHIMHNYAMDMGEDVLSEKGENNGV